MHNYLSNMPSMAYIFEVHRLVVFVFIFCCMVCWCICFLLNSFLFSFSLYAIIRDGLCQVHTNSINYYCEGSEHSYEVNGNSVYIIILRTKNILKMNKVGMLLQKRTDTRGVGISRMRKSKYLLTAIPTSHTHRLHPIPLATPAFCSPSH